MMMNLLSFSQKDSIRKIILNKDTGAFVPVLKIKQINKIIVDLDECKEINDTLKFVIKNYDIAYTKLDSALYSKKMEVSKKDSIIISGEKIIKDQELLLNRKEWDIKILKVQRNFLIPIVGILTAILLVPWK
jgi:hypothetical protein